MRFVSGSSAAVVHSATMTKVRSVAELSQGGIARTPDDEAETLGDQRGKRLNTVTVSRGL